MICKSSLFALISCIALTTTPTFASSQADLLKFIRHYEAGGNYQRYYAGIRKAPAKPITQMTVAGVLTWQKSLGKTRSTAAGAYQIIRPTLKSLVRKHNINPNAKFDIKMQDHLAKLLISNCEYKNTQSDNIRFANCLAGIWAALPLVSGPNKGRSKYHGIAGNRALTKPHNVLAMLSGKNFKLNSISAQTAAYQVTQPARVKMSRVQKIKACINFCGLSDINIGINSAGI